MISRLLDLSAIVICYQVTDNALWELFSYLLSPSPPFWYCQGIGNWVLSDIDNFTYICLHENEFFRPLTLTGQKIGDVFASYNCITGASNQPQHVLRCVSFSSFVWEFDDQFVFYVLCCDDQSGQSCPGHLHKTGVWKLDHLEWYKNSTRIKEN